MWLFQLASSSVRRLDRVASFPKFAPRLILSMIISRRCFGQFLVAAASNRREETDTGWDKQRGRKTPEENSAKGNPESDDEEIVLLAMYVITNFS
jgi:hypothetical protein